MINLHDKRWRTFDSGYRIPYDASTPLKKLAEVNSNHEEVMKEFWEELHHQGDVGIASYAVIPHLVRIYKERKIFDSNLPAFIATINRCSFTEGNPEIPDWLKTDYEVALFECIEYCIGFIRTNWTYDILQSFLMLVSSVKGNQVLSDIISYVEPGNEEEQLEGMMNS